MKMISRMLLVASVGFLALASAEELNKSWNAGNTPQLRVEAGDASIEVQGSDTNTVRLKLVTEGVSIGPGGVELIEHQADGALDLRIQEHSRDGGWHHRSIHVLLVVPKNLTGVVKTGDGSIRLADIGGKLRADTGDGSIDGTGLHGALDAHTGDGSMRLEGVFNDVRLRTGDGSIHLRAGTGSKVDMGWQLASGDGNISVEIPKDLAADLDARTGDGRISANLPLTVNDLNGKHEIHGRLNGGGAPITIRTGDGSIHLGSL